MYFLLFFSKTEAGPDYRLNFLLCLWGRESWGTLTEGGGVVFLKGGGVTEGGGICVIAGVVLLERVSRPAPRCFQMNMSL